MKACAVAPVDSEQLVLLPVGPFARWLVDELAVIARGSDEPGQAFAARLGVSHDCLRAWMHARRCMRLDTIDRALCQAGVPHMLRELYPDLYEERTVA